MAASDHRGDEGNSPESSAELTEGRKYECKPDHSYGFDIPTGWKENSTAMCGVTWPSETPFTEISECCTGPVQVSNACFHYCQTDLPDHVFLKCAHKHMDVRYIGVRCNSAASPNHGHTILGLGNDKTAGLLSSMKGYSGYIIAATFGMLIACFATQFISTSASVRRRIWSCLGMFLGVLVLMALCGRVWMYEREEEMW